MRQFGTFRVLNSYIYHCSEWCFRNLFLLNLFGRGGGMGGGESLLYFPKCLWTQVCSLKKLMHWLLGCFRLSSIISLRTASGWKGPCLREPVSQCTWISYEYLRFSKVFKSRLLICEVVCTYWASISQECEGCSLTGMGYFNLLPSACHLWEC